MATSLSTLVTTPWVAQPHHAEPTKANMFRLSMLMAWVLASTPAAAAGVADGAQLAMDHGCMNCHSNQSHSAPTLTRLTERMAAKGDSPDVLRQRLAELRSQTGIQGHQSTSDASLLLILQWLAQGAK